MEQSPDVVYLDVVVSNINSGDASNFTKVFAEYNEARTIPYLYDPNEYYGAVVQFTLDKQYRHPIIAWKPKLSQTNQI
jgi:hypothetical protein